METKECLNCSTAFSGNYCNSCGEKVYTQHDKSIAHLFEEVTHFLTHFEGKFFKSLKAMFTKPGLMAYDYCRGLRKRYFKPVSLYILIVVIYLLFPLVQGLNMPLENYRGSRFDDVVESTILKKQEHKHLTFDELRTKFAKKSEKVSKLMLIIILPLCALVLMVLLWNKKGYYFFDHFILSAEINSFFIIFEFFIIPLLFPIAGLVVPISVLENIDESIILYIAMAVMMFYATMAFRRFYQCRLPEAILKSIVFCFAQSYIVYVIYKFLLFTTVMVLI